MTSLSAIRNKSVRFVDDNDALSSVWIYEAFSTDVLWVTNEVHEEGRRTARSEARKGRQWGVDSLLHNTFTAATDKTVQRSLNEFTKSKANGRGFERSISREHCQVRKEHRVRAIKAIIMAQAEAKERGYELVELTDQLRLLSIKFSVNAKIFARRMGKADEACCYSRKSRRNPISSPLKTNNEESLMARPSLPCKNTSSGSAKSRVSQRLPHAMTA